MKNQPSGGTSQALKTDCICEFCKVYMLPKWNLHSVLGLRLERSQVYQLVDLKDDLLAPRFRTKLHLISVAVLDM